MIQINVLPFHLRPVKRSPLPYVASVLVLALALLGSAAVWIGGQAQVSAKRGILEQHQQELKELKPIVDQFNELADQELKMAKKIATIQEIVSDRIIWSRQLHNISRLTPDNFWYSSICEVVKPHKETVQAKDPKTGEMKPKTVTVNQRVLELGGYVVKGDDGSNDISPLTSRTQEDAEFANLFKLQLTNFSDTEFKSYRVRNFTFQYEIKAGGDAAAQSKPGSEGQ